MLLEKKYEGILNVNNSLILLDKVDAEEKVLDILIEEGEDKVYDDVVAGGTFDRIHPGHKILLSEAVLRSRKRLTIGVADGPLLKRKVLKELILPCPERILSLREFLSDIDRCLEYNLVTIEEPMGPTSYDPKMEMIVVSEETKKGVQMINDYRKDKGLNELENYCIKVFDDSQKQFIEEEDKFSSSSQRMRLLGTRIRKVTPNLSIPDVPYVIGLTGGSASGKTNIGRVLKEMGAAVVDCDKLGHKAYEYGTKCYEKLVEVFGGEIVNEDNTINRKVLGSMVFNSKDKLKQLTDIVWPQIALLAKKEMKVQFESGKKVMVLDAAVLLEAQWDQFCHEVWVATIDQEEAIRRI
ncbi:UNVERIFIED_CONTAM: hypothetical protein GTU68_026031, partial [Idotea baltica]|nr:hypothetical protein [Idotea baltica]